MDEGGRDEKWKETFLLLAVMLMCWRLVSLIMGEIVLIIAFLFLPFLHEDISVTELIGCHLCVNKEIFLLHFSDFGNYLKPKVVFHQNS